jgi:hypothetical protein
MDPKGKGIVINDKEKESLLNKPRDDKPTDSGSSHKKRDGKKKRRIKKIICYDSDASSSSPRDDDDSSLKKKTVNQNYSFDYSRIPYNSNAMHFDKTDNPVVINEQIHKNAQATTVLLASLYKDEYNKVSGLDNAKQI